MKLEKEIKQTAFRNDYHKLVVNLVYTGSWVEIKNTEMLKPYRLTPQQFNILRILRGQHPKPATVNLLIERMLDKMSNASRIVDKLVSKNLAERKISPSDRRCVDVIITDRGMKLLGKIDERQKEWEMYFKNLNLKETKELNKLLDKLRG